MLYVHSAYSTHRQSALRGPVWRRAHAASETPGKAGFQQCQQQNKPRQRAHRKKHHQQVQRACDIIGKQPNHIAAQSLAKGVKQVIFAQQNAAKLRKKGHILAVHVHCKQRLFAKWGKPCSGVHRRQQQHRRRKGRRVQLPSCICAGPASWAALSLLQAAPRA